MDINEFQVESTEIKYTSNRWTVRSTEVLTPDGKQKWERIRSKSPGLVIIPINTEGKVGVISQNRIKEDDKSHIIYEFPSGWMETDSLDVSEDEVKDNANRELQEEIGFKAKDLKILSQFQLGNFAVVPFYILLATNLEENKLKADDGEVIVVEWLTLDEAEKKLLKDQIPTAQVILSVQELQKLNSNNYSNQSSNSRK
ncbi:NUDIX hydrolase [soil metagenome]